MLGPSEERGIYVSRYCPGVRQRMLTSADLRRMIVHPEHQKKGIGQRMLQWGVDLADREGIVGWLFARPAAARLYEKNGWKAVTTINFDVPDLEVAPLIAMLRPIKREPAK
jgi:GNAT superfamily N-acetyltransferase